jgi:DNA-binding LacI/PurR family transcriptional regulator
MKDPTRKVARKPRITVKDLARDLGMSVATVSRAFYQDAVIAPETRGLVLKRAAEIGYRPNPFAQSLITKRTGIVGLVVSDITNPFYPEVLTRLTEQLQAIDMNVMLVAASPSRSIDDALGLLLSYQPDIAVVLAATLSSAAAAACRAAGTPVIFFNRRAADAGAFSVTCDNVLGGETVADHLADLGHQRLAFVAGRADTSTNVDRWNGFRARVRERGLAEPLDVEAGGFSYEQGFAAAGRLLERGARPDGVFCANDIVAIGVMDALQRLHGLKIPEDISVVGFDDIAMASWPSHALTTVRQPVEEMLKITVGLVDTLSRGGSSEARAIRIPGTLIERSTTRRRP